MVISKLQVLEDSGLGLNDAQSQSALLEMLVHLLIHAIIPSGYRVAAVQCIKSSRYTSVNVQIRLSGLGTGTESALACAAPSGWVGQLPRNRTRDAGS